MAVGAWASPSPSLGSSGTGLTRVSLTYHVYQPVSTCSTILYISVVPLSLPVIRRVVYTIASEVLWHLTSKCLTSGCLTSPPYWYCLRHWRGSVDWRHWRRSAGRWDGSCHSMHIRGLRGKETCCLGGVLLYLLLLGMTPFTTVFGYSKGTNPLCQLGTLHSLREGQGPHEPEDTSLRVLKQ